jgi:hypothetical protein
MVFMSGSADAIYHEFLMNLDRWTDSTVAFG